MDFQNDTDRNELLFGLALWKNALLEEETNRMRALMSFTNAKDKKEKETSVSYLRYYEIRIAFIKGNIRSLEDCISLHNIRSIRTADEETYASNLFML